MKQYLSALKDEQLIILAKNNDEVLYICFSTGIAGTFQAANLAAEEIRENYPDFQITIIDSKCASEGFGLVVEKLLLMQKNGADKELIIEAAKYFCEHMEHAVTVQELNYLFAGGRLSRTSFLAGSALNIKPIIVLDENGSLKATEKVRGWKKALNRLVEMAGEKGKNLERQMIGICYGTDRESAEYLKQLLISEYLVKEVRLTRVGCAIGAHTGPTIIAVVFQNDIDEKFEKYL